MTGLVITTLGTFNLSYNDAPLGALASRKAEALLVYLAYTRRAQRRDLLAELLWDDLPAQRARGNLSVLLSSLRSRLPGFFAIDRQQVGLLADAPLQIDALVLSDAAALLGAADEPAHSLTPPQLARLEQAAALYGGDFLAGFSLRDGRGFEQWMISEQERLRNLIGRMLLALGRSALAAGTYAAGITHVRRLLQLEPLHEDAHHLLMMLLVHAGQRAAALNHYEEFCRLLDQELDAAPAERTTALYRTIWRGEFVAAPAHSPTSPALRRGLGAALRGAPFLATSFVGRDAELAGVLARLADPNCRLLTLVGPGGVGKTRLALRAAADVAPQLRDGGVFVALAGLSDESQVAPAIAAALRLPLRGSTPPLDQVSAFLREREVLLLLDNAEHLADLADVVTQLLAATAGLRVLVTSREPLALLAEWLMPVGGLDLPEFADEAAIADSSAVRLFLQRVAAVRPDFELAAAPPAAVVQICRLSEGLPLAIELAAVAVRERPCPQIAAELARNSDLLSVSLRDLPDRHRSLRAVFNYSWQLLNAGERDLLARTAIFRGSFSPQAAAVVCAIARVEPLLQDLVTRSQLRSSDDGRYSFHELLRQLATERLPAGLADDLADRHAHYFLALLEQAAPGLRRGDPTLLEELRADLDNLRAAWAHAVVRNDSAAIWRGLHGFALLDELEGRFGEGAARVTSALAQPGLAGLQQQLTAIQARYLLRLGRYDEALPVLESVQPHILQSDAPALAAEVQVDLATAHWRVGDLAAAREHALAARDQAASAMVGHVEAAAERVLGNIARQQGNAADAEAHIRRSLALAHQDGNRRDESRALNILGSWLEERGAYDESYTRLTEALRLARDLGDRPLEGIVLGNLGNVARDLGDHQAAHDAYRDSLIIYQALGDRYGEGILRFSLANSAADWGDFAEAAAEYGASLQIAIELGDRLGESLALMGLGNLARWQGDLTSAERDCRQAWELAQTIAALPFEAVTATALGQALIEQGRCAEAAAMFEQAAALRSTIGETHRIVEVQAGLARAALCAGDLAAALRYSEPVYAVLVERPLQGVSEPLLIYLSIGQVFAAAHDSRAEHVYGAARDLLRARAGQIRDSLRREAYLSAIPAHRMVWDTR